MTRVSTVIIKDGRVALIERRRGDGLEYSFPGCDASVEDSPEAAAARRVRRTLGLDVTVGRLLADIAVDGEPQLFFLAQTADDLNPTSRNVETRTGDRPVWLPIFGLTALPVQPKAVALLVEFSGNGWPHEVLTLTDRTRTRQPVPVA